MVVIVLVVILALFVILGTFRTGMALDVEQFFALLYDTLATYP